MSFFDELKRRNVFRVAAAYTVAGWLLVQVADIFVPALHLPEWITTALAFFLLIGFPIALFFAWAFELTPEGIKRETEIAEGASITHETAARLNHVTIVLLVAVAALVLVDRFVLDHPGSNASPTAEPVIRLTAEPSAAVNEGPSVAVLPFVNMSDDEGNEYFSDGISEELLNVLVGIEGLRVPSRTSSFSFKGSTLKLSDIGRELGVDHVLEGSVRKAGDRIRVTAQLIDVRSDTHLWSETYTRELDDIFAVQDEISSAIVDALKLTLTGEDKARIEHRSTEQAKAYNQYLLGRHWWHQRIPGRMAEAIAPLKKAVELDPEFDQAWAALADVYLLLPEYGEGSVSVYIPLALDATQRALDLNPESARALTTSAYIKGMHQYQWGEAEREFQRAIELEPGYVTAHQWYAEMLAVQRRIDEALHQLDLASKADPLAPIIPHIKGWICNWDNRLDEAEHYYIEALRLDPGFPYAVSNLALVYIQTGEFDKSRAQWQEFGRIQNAEGAISPFLLVVDAVENPALREQAVATLQDSNVPIDPFNAPVNFAFMGRYDLALEAILRNYETGGPYAPHVNRMKIFDPLRDDPRFQAMLADMNLLDE